MAPNEAPMKTANVPRTTPPPKPKGMAKTKPAPNVKSAPGMNKTVATKYTEARDLVVRAMR